jgi:hypothetical protein
MKRVITILLVMILAVTSSCEKSNLPKGTPDCIQSSVNEGKKDANWKYARVDEYEYQGKVVYAFEPDTRIIADASTDIFDRDCKRICSVGGFGGPMINQCNGENFFQKAKLLGNIWKKY